MTIDGNADNLEIKAGLDACVDLPVVGEECGADLTSELPLYILDVSPGALVSLLK